MYSCISFFFLIFKANLHSANFSRANGTVRWRMLSFRSPFEENEIWIISKATYFKKKLIITKSAENSKLF